MKCPHCQAENPPGMRFCGQCAAPLAAVCPSCGSANPPGNKFCGQCATPLDGSKGLRFAAPEAYTPKHLAERILTSKSALEGERKQVTVLFADLKGSMELLADRDPEEARKILDPAAIQAGRRALVIGESRADVAIQIAANGYLGYVCVARGECREAVRHCEAALALIPEGVAQERFGQDVIQASNVRTALAKAFGALGQFPEAFARLREAMQIAEGAGHDYSLLFPLFGLGTLKLDQGDFASAVAPLERGLDLCRTREVPWLLHDFAWALGAAYHGTGRRAEAVALMEDAARGLVGGIVALLAWRGRVGALGGAYLLDGRLADATRIAQDGLAAARQRGEREVEGRVLRLLGDIATHPDRFEVDIAEAHYRQALTLAEELGLRPLMAHCRLGLGKLSRRTGKREQAQEHLTTATTMYREMDMTYWLEKAETEMKEL